MTDIEKLLDLMSTFGLTDSLEEQAVSGLRTVELFKGEARVKGHPGFFTRFEFTPGGRFLRVGVWT